MAARQQHGFDFESYCKEQFHVLDCPEGHYTYKWDGILNGKPVSIKTEKIGSDIEIASLQRNAENEEDFYLIVGFWKGNKENIISIETLYIIGNEWHQLFDLEIVNECSLLVKEISNDAKDDALWKKCRSELTKKWKQNTPNLIRPRFKRDHKTQKRMQCAINNKDFYCYFLPKYQKEVK